MSVTLGWVLLNTAYLIYTTSGLFKDMLRLRLVWMLSTLFFLAHGLVDELWPAVFWNIPVLLVHVWMVSSLIRQRRGIDLNDEAEAIRTLIFPDLDRASFNTLWHRGDERIVRDTVLITKGEPVHELFLILDGEVDAKVREGLIVRLSEYRLLGEISTLRGTNATATVTTTGIVRMRVWNKESLDECGKKHPTIQVALIKAMGEEAARKLN